MSRGYWRFILAAFGCLIALALPPQDGARAQNTQSEQTAEQSLGEIADSLNAATNREDYNPECEPGQDNRRSDLCAQWKAADGAHNSAIWTERAFWLGVGGLTVGFLTLAAAVAAVLFARDAAREAKRGADFAGQMALDGAAAIAASVEANNAMREANEISGTIAKDEARAYLNVLNVKASVQDGTATFICDIKNTGRTPAKYVEMELVVGFHVLPVAPADFERNPRIITLESQGIKLHNAHLIGIINDIGGNDLVPNVRRSVQAPFLTLVARRAMQQRQGSFFVQGKVFYCDIFGRHWEEKVIYHAIRSTPLDFTEEFELQRQVNDVRGMDFEAKGQVLEFWGIPIHQQNRAQNKGANHPPPPEEGQT